MKLPILLVSIEIKTLTLLSARMQDRIYIYIFPKIQSTNPLFSIVFDIRKKHSFFFSFYMHLYLKIIIYWIFFLKKLKIPIRLSIKLISAEYSFQLNTLKNCLVISAVNFGNMVFDCKVIF